MHFNLGPQEHADEILDALHTVVDSGYYILGPQVSSFEEEFACFQGARYAVGVGSGTDAIAIALRAIGVKAGDEVITPAFNVAYTAMAISLIGAIPVLADVTEEDGLLDPKDIERRVTPKTAAIVPVHLYGQVCDMPAIMAIANKYGLGVVEDSCQAHGTRLSGHAAAFSFYPTKNLGALGDGGAIVTNDEGSAKMARMIRDGGRVGRYNHDVRGMNSCLDEMQAAILRVKLKYFLQDQVRRVAAAEYYNKSLPSIVKPLTNNRIYHLYVVRSKDRDSLHDALINWAPVFIHYPKAVHENRAFNDLGKKGEFPIAEQWAREVLSLPLYPAISRADQNIVKEQIRLWERDVKAHH